MHSHHTAARRDSVPDGKTNFRWYMNLDGTNTTIQDMTVEGRF